MRATWNDELAAWEASASQAVSREPGFGPVGPAGVSVLRAGGASISFCTMTGRVTSTWVPGQPDEHEHALYELVFGRPVNAARFGRDGGEPFDDAAPPVAEHVVATHWASMRDTVTHVDLSPDAPAQYLARLEYAAALRRVRSSGTAGQQLVSSADLADAVQAANDAASQLSPHSPAVDRLAGMLKRTGHRQTARTLLETTLRSFDSPGAAADLGGAVLEELSIGFLASPAHTLLPNEADSILAEHRVDVLEPTERVRWASFGAAETASRAGWVALQQARARGEMASNAAGLIFAEATVAWLQLGAEFRAAWCWTLADHDEASQHIAAAGLGESEDALIAKAGSVNLAGSGDYLAPALWMLVEPVNHLLPRPASETAELGGPTVFL